MRESVRVRPDQLRITSWLGCRISQTNAARAAFLTDHKP